MRCPQRSLQLILFALLIDEMFVNNGLIWIFSATELVYSVYKANKCGLDSLDRLFLLRTVRTF